MAGIGDYKKGKAFELRSGKTPAFKMLGSSPMKQVNIQTGFGPEADANLKNKVNPKKVAKVAKKGAWHGVKKAVKFALGKAALPVMAVINAPKLGEKHGVKKFAGSMIWDKDLFLNKKESKETYPDGNKMFTPSTPNLDNQRKRQSEDKVGDLYNYKSLR